MTLRIPFAVLLASLIACSAEDRSFTNSTGSGGGNGSGQGAGGGSPASSGAGAGGGSSKSCGDGDVNGNEQCDDGPDNGPGKACNADCRLNVCGDGDQGPGESCDNGTENGLELLRCAPDCSRIIEQKAIILSNELTSGDLGANPVAMADAQCPVGYKAMFSFGQQRRATTTPNDVKNPIDWVLQPYTYYYNEEQNPVWLTRDVPLLGMDNGVFVGLENPVEPLVPMAMLTGMNDDWTTLGGENCNGWSVTFSQKRHGWSVYSDITFMYTDADACDLYNGFYCVEQ
jgi:hypothetical protein